MIDSALGKVERASKHIAELEQRFQDHRPFRYVLATNTRIGERSTYSKTDNKELLIAAEIAADAIHNLRAALDHAYWEIVSPHVTDGGHSNIQFPFSKTAAGLEAAVKNRHAHKVSAKFFDGMMDLRPHGEAGGNQILYLVHHLDALDKHRFPIPTAFMSNLDTLRDQVPDMPPMGTGFRFINDGSGKIRDLTWTTRYADSRTAGNLVPPSTHLFEKELEIPIDIVFDASGLGRPDKPFLPTLVRMSDLTRSTIETIRNLA